MTRNRPQNRQALALAIAEDRAGQEVLRAAEAAEDPIVAWELIHIFSLTGNPLVTVLTGNRTLAMQTVFDLDGPYTTKDFNIRAIRRSEREARKRGRD